MADSLDESVDWPELQRVRCTIVVLDVVESVLLAQLHEADFIGRWRRLVQYVLTDVLPRFNGKLVKSLGDGMLLAFEQAPQAVTAALEVRHYLKQLNAGRTADAQIRLRFGINIADVVFDELDVYGAGVNLAARLAALAEPDDIVMSAAVNEQLLPGLDVETEDMGDCWLKHIVEPVRAYHVFGNMGSAAGRPLPAFDGPLRPTIAVFPFTAEGAFDSHHAVGDLLADELISALSTLPELQVVSRLSTTALARRGGDSAAAGAALEADFLLTGSCRSLGTKLLVHGQLHDTRRGEVVRTFREVTPLASLLALDSSLMTDLVSQTAAAILERQVDLARHCALPNLAGYTLLLGGITLMHRLQRKDFDRAGQLLLHLCERWPRLPAPHAWLARWRLFKVLQGWSDDAVQDRSAAFESSERALDLDAGSSIALTVAGALRTGLSRDVDGGIALYEEALRSNPNDSLAWMLLGTAHAFKGDGATASHSSAQAIRLSPLDPLHFMYDCHAAGSALAAGDYALALTLAQRSLRANAQHLSTFRVLAIAQQLGGDGDGARATVARLRTLDATLTVAGYLRTAPSAAYPMGQKCARALAEAGLPP